MLFMITTRKTVVNAKKEKNTRNNQLVNLKDKQVGVVYIQSTRNNTILTLSDIDGNTKTWSSAGTAGFKNSRKSSTHAAEMAATLLGEKTMSLGFNSIKIKMSGLGYGKQKAVAALHHCGLKVFSIEEITPLSHNGCRPPRKRRI